jgi:hypothetical protein
MKNLSTFLAIICTIIYTSNISLHAQGAFGAESCSTIKPSTDVVLATICETEEEYIFSVQGDVTAIKKVEFRHRLNQAIFEWWTSRDLDVKALFDAKIEIWLSIPDANPESYQLRAIVNSKAGGVIFGFDVHDSHWFFDNQNAGILANQKYPDSYGWRPHALVVSVHPGVDRDALIEMLKDAGIELGEEFAPTWYAASTHVLDEIDAQKRLLNRDQEGRYLRSVQLNNLFEWIGYRGKGFEYRWTRESSILSAP